MDHETKDTEIMTVMVKCLNGEILHITLLPTQTLPYLKMVLSDTIPEAPVHLQSLVRLTDGVNNPTDLHDGDLFGLMIQPPKITFFLDYTYDQMYIDRKLVDHCDIITAYVNHSYGVLVAYDESTNSFTNLDEFTYVDYYGMDRYYNKGPVVWHKTLADCIRASKMYHTEEMLERVDEQLFRFRCMTELVERV
jgi:hypothetical protein